MWNPNSMSVDSPEDDDSWEVKAFAEDAGNAMGATWPPRSYTCTFCRREFRSAQALGGHMNVHRRDRARLHQAQVSLKNPNLTEELVGDSGVCLLFSLPNPNAIFKPTSLNHFSGNSSRVLSVTPRPSANNLMNFPHSSNIEASASVDRKHNERFSHNNEKKKKKTDLAVEGIDLELRLGCSSSGS